MPKTLYERDMEDSLTRIAAALGLDMGGTPDVEALIRAAQRAGERCRDFDALQRALVGETGASAIAVAGECRELLRDIDANMRRAQRDGSLRVAAWPAGLAARLAKVMSQAGLREKSERQG